MIRQTRVLGRGLFAAVLLGALGFGTTQALASPAAAKAAHYCTRQDQSVCLNYCYDTYGEGYRARCYKDYFGFIDCECYQFTPSSGT